jgi:glucokinase
MPLEELEIAAADIGGTHARFAIATIRDRRVTNLTSPLVVKSADYPSLQAAWAMFVGGLDRPAPRAAAIALATPVDGEVLQLTNSPWVIRRAEITAALGLDRYLLVNDFGAVAHAVAQLGDNHFARLCGPDLPLPGSGVISIIGPGTGLGVAMLSRGPDGDRVIEAEGGHAAFAPLDSVEDRILADLRRRHGRVSVERVVSGPGLANIHRVLTAIEGRAGEPADDAALWGLALNGEDSLATAALERFCLTLGSTAGDIALTQGGVAVVIAGGVAQRLGERLAESGFDRRFRAKGRFESRLAAMPVKRLTHPQPGLFGAAAAFAQHCDGG